MLKYAISSFLRFSISNQLGCAFYSYYLASLNLLSFLLGYIVETTAPNESTVNELFLGLCIIAE